MLFFLSFYPSNPKYAKLESSVVSLEVYKKKYVNYDRHLKQISSFEPRHEISNNVVCATSKGSDQPAHMQSDQSICLWLDCSLSAKLLTEHHLEFLSLKGDFIDSSESTLVKMLHFWKSHVFANLCTNLHVCTRKFQIVTV